MLLHRTGNRKCKGKKRLRKGTQATAMEMWELLYAQLLLSQSTKLPVELKLPKLKKKNKKKEKEISSNSLVRSSGAFLLLEVLVPASVNQKIKINK